MAVPLPKDLKAQQLELLRERQRRNTLPFNQYTPDVSPDRDQLRFHTSNKRFRLAFGGNRSGKSVVTAYETAAFARSDHRFQDIPLGPKNIYVISAEYRTLYQGIYFHLAHDRTGMRFLDERWIKSRGAKVPGATVPLPSYIEVYSKFDHDGNLVTANNYSSSGGGDKDTRPFSTIWFISGDGGEQARKKLQAASLDLVVIDEEVGEDLFSELKMRLLDTGGRMCISATLVQSEDWLLELEDRGVEGDSTVELVRLNTETNKHINELAKKELLGSLSEEEKHIRVSGKSRRQFGLVYGNFGSQHVRDLSNIFERNSTGTGFKFPDHFLLFSANDAGWKIHAWLWAAVDPHTYTVYFYREFYGKEQTLEDTMHDVAELEGYELVPAESKNVINTVYYRRPASTDAEKIEHRLMDPANFRNLEDGNISVGIQMAAYYDTGAGPANNDKQSGIESSRKLLEINSQTGKPFAMFDISLVNFFRERRKYKFRQDKSSKNAHAMKAEPIKKDDHLMDTFRYLSTYISYMFTGDAPLTDNKGRFNQGMNMDQAATLQEKVHAHAAAIRAESAGPMGQHPFLGTDW